MDAAHHHHQWPAHQGIGLVKPMEEFASAMAAAITTASSGKPRPPPPPPPPAAAAAASERKTRPQKEQALNCPRCNSTNTKFCYYNNYSLTQPRYFCKTCRRYWTEGGSLRNVPVGGGSRNNKRCSSSSTSSINGAQPYKKLPNDLINPPSTISAAPKFHEFADRYPSLETSSSARGLLTPFTPPISTPEFTAARFGLEEFRLPPPPPTLNFGLDALGGGYGGKTMLFPFEELKPPMVSNNYAVEHHHQFEPNKEGQSGGDHPPTFWSGVVNGGGSWWNTTLN